MLTRPLFKCGFRLPWAATNSRLTCTAILAILLFGTLDTAHAELSEPYRVREVSGCVNVRAHPDTSEPTFDCLETGVTVTVVSAVPYWREVTYGNDARGWMAKKFLEPMTPAALLPEDAGIPPDAFLEVHFVDVGQGDAIWIQTHDDGIDGNGRFEGYSIIIDGGPYSSDTRNPIIPYLEERGHHGAELEAIIVSHPHTDHFRGAETLSRHFEVNHYYDPGYPSTLVSYARFLDAMRGTAGAEPRARNIHIGQSEFGALNWGSELKVEVLYAYDPALSGMGSGNTLINNASIVLRLEYGEHVFLFMGDAEGKDRGDPPDPPQYVEKQLLQAVPDRLKATVLKIGHHGSETSSTLPYIQAVDPEIVVVQSGRKDFNGTFLPDATTLSRYCAHNPNVLIYRTDQNDAEAGLTESNAADGDHVVIRTNGAGSPQVEAFDGGQPFPGGGCSS